MNLDGFVRSDTPFPHWTCANFVPWESVRQINAEWPGENYPGWRTENGRKSKKSSLLFPARLPPAAQQLAEAMMSPESCVRLSEITGIDLLPDPWLMEGPTVPRLGGGLHEIHENGLLGMHLDFTEHPSGLTRCLNLLVYLNEQWDPAWGGALELGLDSPRLIYPHGGVAVMFQTTPVSWHGHPHPLRCPRYKSRRSLALYFYKRDADRTTRPTTVYR